MIGFDWIGFVFEKYTTSGTREREDREREREGRGSWIAKEVDGMNGLYTYG